MTFLMAFLYFFVVGKTLQGLFTTPGLPNGDIVVVLSYESVSSRATFDFRRFNCRTIKDFCDISRFRTMGRGRAKGKRQSVTNQDDPGSGEEEKVPPQKRRGRPQKSLKDEVDEEEAQKIEDGDSEDTTGLPNKDMGSKTVQIGKKRTRNAQADEKGDSVKEENGDGMRSNTQEMNKSNGFRQNGNRRKNKPRRAAEAVVECN